MTTSHMPSKAPTTKSASTNTITMMYPIPPPDGMAYVASAQSNDAEAVPGPLRRRLR